MTKHYIYLETTTWEEPTQANHVYVFTEPPKTRSVKCMGYVKAGTTELIVFSKPMKLDLKDRKFVALT